MRSAMLHVVKLLTINRIICFKRQIAGTVLTHQETRPSVLSNLPKLTNDEPYL